MYPGPKSRQVCAGGEHQHVGVSDGDDPALAAAAEQHPNHQGEQGPPFFPAGTTPAVSSSAEMLSSLTRTLAS